MRAALLWTINNFPAYGMLSGWSTYGKFACPYYMEHTKSFALKGGSKKPCWFDCHRWFLPEEHPFHKQKDAFKKSTQERAKPISRLSGKEIKDRLDQFDQIMFGRACGQQKLTGFGKEHNWKKVSIFWELPYWSTNLIRHNLDVMHVEKKCVW